MSYNAIAMVTDYDCWKDDTEAVDAQHVLKVIKENVERVRALFVQAVKFIGQHDWEDVIKSNQVFTIFLIASFFGFCLLCLDTLEYLIIAHCEFIYIEEKSCPVRLLALY